jgi:hypothetical protein
MPIKREMMVRKDALEQIAINETIAPEPQEGAVLLEIEAFALTANNVTYAVVGETVKYWNFFPAAEGWGIVPVWGHARVAASRDCGGRAGLWLSADGDASHRAAGQGFGWAVSRYGGASPADGGGVQPV